jgi:hypothetical protein
MNKIKNIACLFFVAALLPDIVVLCQMAGIKPLLSLFCNHAMTRGWQVLLKGEQAYVFDETFDG